VRAKNSIGYSEFSNYTVAAAATLPAQPTVVSKSNSLSSKTSITVTWAKVANTEIETSGYILKMAAEGSELYSTVYYGVNRP